MTGQLAFVESPVQLLNVLEWAHTRGRAAGAPAAAPAGPYGPADAAASGPAGVDASGRESRSTDAAPGAAPPAPDLTVVVLSPSR
ncbi:hypothetical protein [Streptomyces sp. NPDC001919]